LEHSFYLKDVEKQENPRFYFVTHVNEDARRELVTPRNTEAKQAETT
jgi:hypothetical protein